MLSEKRKLKLGANIKGLGSTTDGWRHSDAEPDASINIEFYKNKRVYWKKDCSALSLLRTD